MKRHQGKKLPGIVFLATLLLTAGVVFFVLNMMQSQLLRVFHLE